jgi:hypothetical protein
VVGAVGGRVDADRARGPIVVNVVEQKEFDRRSVSREQAEVHSFL